MTLGTPAAREHSLATTGVTWLFEEPHRVKVSEQVCGGLLVHFPRMDTPFAHGSPHGRRVVPHDGCQGGRSKVPIDHATQVRANAGALSVNRMTLNALERFEKAATARRVRCHHCRMDTGRRNQKDGNPAHHGVILTPAVIT